MRHRVALILQAIAGAFGFYGVGRLIIGQWGRGLIELLGLGFLVIVALPMVGVNLFGRSVWYGMYCQGIVQILLSVLLALSMWRDLKRQDEVGQVEGEQWVGKPTDYGPARIRRLQKEREEERRKNQQGRE